MLKPESNVTDNAKIELLITDVHTGALWKDCTTGYKYTYFIMLPTYIPHSESIYSK